ncbi:ATP-grasp domain-containing protein [Desulfobotulus sp. H1]|uniref:ATP-grasp domain-containing protein n=1 Tax=Desulfobotulus pelophilus TaxID=2823377 RepID=A0ABT3ND52_9BACT|nr:ATP-grasp domain-containing protein [Desulfobotulus pelophilus]MCW7755399.1 ATP-grasp domain-containing protein [Desulfobotulus pelophilus]
MHKQKIMIAGIGGASLGTEICKALILAGSYEVYGCDISSTAYGMYDSAFMATYKINKNQYIESIVDVCKSAGVRWLVPGGERPMTLLGGVKERLYAEGITLIANSSETVALCSDKEATFQHLKDAGISAPKTCLIDSVSDLQRVGLPCIVKPSTGSGGSVSVFFAGSSDEAMIYAEYIRRNGGVPIAQEYVDIQEGEFTVGVLSYPDGSIASSIAMQRSLGAKLSVAYSGRGAIISSGYSQGYIDYFPDLCAQAERIASSVGSVGPLNVQGRLRNGVFLPFEINPRFSASTYLRALAGFNEIDLYLQHIQTGKRVDSVTIQPGWYLRSLTEQFVAGDQLK